MTNTVLRTTPEAAKRIRHSERTLERWRLEGTGPEFVKAGRKVLYTDSALEAWVNARTFRSTAEADAAAANASGCPAHKQLAAAIVHGNEALGVSSEATAIEGGHS